MGPAQPPQYFYEMMKEMGTRQSGKSHQHRERVRLGISQDLGTTLGWNPKQQRPYPKLGNRKTQTPTPGVTPTHLDSMGL